MDLSYQLPKAFNKKVARLGFKPWSFLWFLILAGWCLSERAHLLRFHPLPKN